MNKEQMKILVNIIGGVESGGQIYGNQRYEAYAGKYANNSNEVTCTLGWAQNYGNEGRKLCRMILEADPAAFRKADTAGIEKKLAVDWVAAQWSPSAKEKAALIAIITTETGKKCQDQLFEELAKTYISNAEKNGVTDVAAQMMWCEIEHLGGLTPTKRIFGRAKKPYTPDSIFKSLLLDQKDTSSSNQVGDKIYQSRHECCVKWIKKYLKDGGTQEEKKEEVAKVMSISNSGGDENGGIHGGKAGDQTGKEWQIRTWYNRPWSCILRHPDAKVREAIASNAEKAARNDHIGYDQYQRRTFYEQLAVSGWDPAKITKDCEADCSAGVIACTIAAGYQTGNAKLKALDPDGYTGSMRQAFKNAGFTVLTDSKYLNSGDYLLRGDILLNDSHHTATNLTDGAKSGGSGADVTPDRSEYLPGECTVKLETFLVGASHPQVKAIQRILNALGYKGKNKKKLTVDGELGENTAYAIEKFQKAKGMENINFGTVAAKTWSYLLNA